MLEKITDNKHINIIDGQQRITTIIIFISAMIKVLESNKNKKDHADEGSQTKNDIDVEEFLKDLKQSLGYLKDDFLIYRDKQKLKVAEFDNDYFKNFVLLNDENTHAPQTPSQKRIKKAKEFFTKELQELPLNKIIRLLIALQKAKILSITFSNKKDSVLMFELQNNRGKDLSDMEKLKSYLAYQLYIYSQNSEIAEQKLNDIAKIFEEIYSKINDIKISEDSMLKYFNISNNDFKYRESDDNLNYKKELKSKDDNKKVEWIEKYIKNLKNAFVNFKTFENLGDINGTNYAHNFTYLEVWEVYPFIIKAYSLFQNDKNMLEQIFSLLEIIAFRHRLVDTKANLPSRLNNVIKNFTSAQNLKDELNKICSDETRYWSDSKIKEACTFFDTNDTKDKNTLKYLLLNYEKYLCSQNATSRGYEIRIDALEIEHIAPQTENEQIENGYCRYDDDFKAQYLNNIGNLVLISRQHNGSNGNRPFKDKVQNFNNSPLLQQREIQDFCKQEWDKKSIEDRSKKIIEFAIKRWSFK